MGLATARKTLTPTVGLGVAMILAGILIAGLWRHDLLWPYLVVGAGLALVVASLFSLARLDTGVR